MDIPERLSSAGVKNGDELCDIILNDIIRYELLAEAETEARKAASTGESTMQTFEMETEMASTSATATVTGIVQDIGFGLDQQGNDTVTATCTGSRFRSVTEDDTDAFLQNSANKNTVYKTRSDMKIFGDWTVSVGEFREITELSRPELDSLLARFYLSVRRKDGSEYEPDSISSIQNSIDRHLRNNKSSINIKTDVEFSHSRRVLEAKRKELKSQGKGNKKQRADNLSPEEIKILYEKGVLGAGNPQSLLHTIWLNNGVFFRFRGRQEHAYLQWGDIELKTDSSGTEYLEFTERNTKTRTGAKHGDYRKVAPRIFAETNNTHCPVKLYKLYSSHRPVCMNEPDARFYLRPLESPLGNIWYSRQPIGKNTIGKMMKVIAGEGNIQGRKVNHTTRKTFATTLLQAGVAPTEVAQLGGWKNLQSLNEYSVPSMDQQRDRSNKLSMVMAPVTEEKENVEMPAPKVDLQLPENDSNPQNASAFPVMSSTANMMALATKKDSNPFSVLCGATINGGTINLNIFSGKRKHFHLSDSQESSQE